MNAGSARLCRATCNASKMFVLLSCAPPLPAVLCPWYGAPGAQTYVGEVEQERAKVDKELERLWWVTSCTPLHSCAVRCFSCGAPRVLYSPFATFGELRSNAQR